MDDTRHDYDGARRYYNEGALYEGKSMGTRRYSFDPYYDENRFGWGDSGGRNSIRGYRNSDGRPSEFDEDSYMDRDYRRSYGYDQRRRPSSSVVGDRLDSRYRSRRDSRGGEEFDPYYDDDYRRSASSARRTSRPNDTMEDFREGRGRRKSSSTYLEEDRAFSDSSNSRRSDRRGASTVNGSYYPRGSTINGSYNRPPRGEANGGMSIDDLKEML